jgi:hypothetical protein
MDTQWMNFSLVRNHETQQYSGSCTRAIFVASNNPTRLVEFFRMLERVAQRVEFLKQDSAWRCGPKPKHFMFLFLRCRFFIFLFSLLLLSTNAFRIPPKMIFEQNFHNDGAL